MFQFLKSSSPVFKSSFLNIDTDKLKNITSCKTLRDSRFRERNQIISLEDLASGQMAKQIFNLTDVICRYNDTVLRIAPNGCILNCLGDVVGVVLPKTSKGRFVAVLNSARISEQVSRFGTEINKNVVVFDFDALAYMFSLPDASELITRLQTGEIYLIDWASPSRTAVDDTSLVHSKIVDQNREIYYDSSRGTRNSQKVMFSSALFYYKAFETQFFVENICDDDAKVIFPTTVGYRVSSTYSSLDSLFSAMDLGVENVIRRGNLYLIPISFDDNALDIDFSRFPFETTILRIRSSGLTIYSQEIFVAPCNEGYTNPEFYMHGGLICFTDDLHNGFGKLHLEDNVWYMPKTCDVLGPPIF